MIRYKPSSSCPTELCAVVGRWFLNFSIFCAALLISSRAAVADLVFLDTYNVDSQTTNLNYEASVRQSGSAAPVTYQKVAVNLYQNQDLSPYWWQLEVPGYEGWLYLNGVCAPGAGIGTGVSTMPNHNFIESTNFTIDFDIIPFTDTDAGGWCGVKVLDADNTATFVNSSSGFGVQISNDGSVTIWDGGTVIGNLAGGTFNVTGSNHVTIAVTTGGFNNSNSGQTELIVTVNGNAVGDYVVNHNYGGGYISMFYALAAPGTTNITAFGNLEVQSISSAIFADQTTVSTMANFSSAPVKVHVPASALVGADVDVTITSINPAIAVPTGSVNGVLTLHFTSGGTNVQNFTVAGVAAGQTIFTLASAQVTTGGNIAVGINTYPLTIVANPSFENGPPGIWPSPGYCFMDQWTPNSVNTGLNGTAEAIGNTITDFLDNGVIPDRELVAFIDGNGSFQQNVSGLAVGSQQWVQFCYNVSDNSYYGGDPVAPHVLNVSYNGQIIASITNAIPVESVGNFTQPWYFTNIAFVPTVSAGTLAFQHELTSTGNATMLIDSIAFALRASQEVVVQNPSFEASGRVPASPYDFENGVNIAGWSLNSKQALWGASMLGDLNFDNGMNPDQSLALFVQDNGTSAAISQTIKGLSPGNKYNLNFAFNTPTTGGTPILQVYIGDKALVSVPVLPVGGVGSETPFYSTNVTFTADASSMTLLFTNADPTASSTFLLDDIHIYSAATPTLAIRPGNGNTVFLEWPTAAVGYVLQTNSSLPGVWGLTTLPVTTVGNLNVVTDTNNQKTLFYRLYHNP